MSFILASGSASRRAILSGAGLGFTVDPADVDEKAIKARFVGDPETLALHLAEAKALAVSARRDGLVLGADQVLEYEGEAFDKAQSVQEAHERLLMLRGKTHWLKGGVVLSRGDSIVWRHQSRCRMVMRDWSDDFHDRYMSKAGDILTKSVGAYAFEGLGVQLFERVEGDYYAVLGLPLLPVLAALRAEGVIEA